MRPESVLCQMSPSRATAVRVVPSLLTAMRAQACRPAASDSKAEVEFIAIFPFWSM